MKITVTFLNGSDYWQNKILDSAARASAILSDPAFLEAVRKRGRFDCTTHAPTQVADRLEHAGEVTIKVGFYSRWWTRAIAYEKNDTVFFNTRKESRGAGSPANIAHEVMHALGYRHNGNYTAGNENTVPYVIGDMVEART